MLFNNFYSDNDLKFYSKTLLSRGWVILPNFLSSNLVANLIEEAILIKKDLELGIQSNSITDEEGNFLVINSLFSKSEFLFDLSRDKEIMNVSEKLLSKSVIPIHCEYFCKPKLGAYPTPPHQDQIFYQSHFDDEMAITYWCPLTDINLGDGALEYAKTDNLMELLPHIESNARDFGMELKDSSEYTFEPVILRKGDCIVHHAYAIHRSGQKTTLPAREAFAFNYRSSSFRENMKGK